MSATGGVRPDHRDLLRRAYAAYDAQDLDALTALVSDDVDWPDGEDRLHGRERVRAYWEAQWTRTRTHDEPLSLTVLDDGRTAVLVSQVVRTLDGSVVSRGRYVHLHRIVDGHLARLDIEDAPGGRTASEARAASAPDGRDQPSPPP